jgi:flavin-dependent dehydrogenase
MPADTVSTHAILRTGVLQLTRWGILERVIAGAPPIRRVVLGFGEERIGFDIRDEHGVSALYAPRRHTLDSGLLEVAIDSGVDFAGGTRVTGVRSDDDERVCGVTVRGSAGTAAITARFVVGADGVNSRIAELVGAPAYRSHPPLNAVHYAYFTGVENRGFWFQFSDGVNAGLIPTHDRATCVFVGRPSRQHPAFRADPEAEFRRLLAAAGADLVDRVSGGSRITPFRGTAGLPGFVKQPWGPGWALVGDAGYVKDPISAHGISDALRDAELCARAVDRALRHPADESESLTAYQRVRDTLSRRMFEESRALAGYGWDVEEASIRMRAVSASVRGECDALMVLPEWPAGLSAKAS